MSLEFNIPKESSSILKVIGVGGGGSNAVNHMYSQGIKGVDFIVCNTDQQALDISPVPLKVQIGETLTGGRGAGAMPEVGRNAAVESLEQIEELLADNTTMVFITAGMGGGTGTGAAPVIAAKAKEMGILTVGIVTIPFRFEGPRRKKLAEEGLERLRDSVDTLLIIKNDKLRELSGNLSVTNAFHESDNILTTAAKGIAEVISSIGYINVDMNDVNTVMKDSGVAIMGSATAQGDDRSRTAVMKALESPLLNDNDIKGARHVLLNITFGTTDITMDELDEITHYIQHEAGDTAEVIMGYGQDESLGDEISVTVIATGFEGRPAAATYKDDYEAPKTYRRLDEEPTPAAPAITGDEITQPLQNPFAGLDQTVNTPEETSEETPYLKQVDDADLADKPLQQDLGFTFDQMLPPRNAEPAQEEQQPTETSWQNELRGIQDTPEETPVSEPTTSYFPQLDEQEQEPEPTHTVDERTIATERETMEQATAPRLDKEEHRVRTEERLERVRENGMKLRTPSGLSELEKEPAYKRKNLKLDDVPHSSETQMSRYTLTDKDTEGITLNKNNPYLNKDVD